MREISMREVGYNVLLRWKTMVVIIVGCMVLLIAFQVLNRSQLGTEQAETQQITEQMFSGAEMQQIDECYEAYLNAEAAARYRDEATIMQIDPFHVNTVVNQYVISCEDYKDTQIIKDSYAYFISSGVIGKRIEKGDMDISSLVSATTTQEGDSAVVLDGEGQTTLIVEVIHQSEKEALELAQEVNAGIAEYCKELNQKIGKHNIECILQEAVVESHNTLINWQSQMRSAASNEKNTYDVKKNSLSAMQLEYFEVKCLGKDMSNIELNNASETTGVSAKLLILDGMVSILIAILYCVISYMLSGKINYTHTLQKSYGLRIFGIFPLFLSEKKNSINKRVKRKIFNVSKDQDVENLLEANVNNIRYYAKKKQVDTIYFDVTQGVDKKYVQTVIKDLEKYGLKCVLSTESSNEYDRIEKIREVGNMILVNKSGKTTYRELEDKMKICEENDIAILGVLLEA